MWLKSNLFVILVILLVINLFDESYAKGGMAKNSGKRKLFFFKEPNMIRIVSNSLQAAKKIFFVVTQNFNLS